jgi:endonuclease YncB( thermonuclease family)
VIGWRRIARLRRFGLVLIAAAGAAALVALVDGFVAAWRRGAPIVGPARVIDGDSLEVAGVKVRLVGVDAPEIRQTCRRGAEEWRCGQEAKARLDELVGAETVRCARVGEDRNRRVLARCRAGDVHDLGARLVRDGWAVSYDASYAYEEAAARLAGRGLWTSDFERPRAWRERHRGDAAE